MFKKTPLSQAIQNDDTDLVRKLVVEGASLEEADELHGPPLIAAIQDEKYDMVRLLLELGADPNGPDIRDWDSPLSEAAMQRDIEAVQLLLQSAADPNLIRNDSIPLVSAVCENDVRIAKLLIDAGADVYLSNGHGVNAVSEIEESSKVMATLIRAAAAEPNENAKLLDTVRAGVASGTRQLAAPAPPQEKIEASVEAIKLGHVQVLHALLEAGTDPNGSFGKSAIHLLHLAIFNDDKACCEELIAAGADPNTMCKIFLHAEMTALMLAIAEKSGPLVKMMLAAGGDVTKKAGDGETALSLARKTGRKQIFKLIETAVEQAGGSSDKIELSLHEAVREGRGDVVRQMLDAGADANEPDLNGKTPVMDAIEHSDVKLLELLLDKGGDPCLSWPERNECTWSKVVQQRAAVKLAELLIKHVDDPRDLCRSIYPGDQGALGIWLHLCGLGKKGVDKITGLLIERGLDVNQRLHNGWTPLLVVARHANAKTVDILTVLLDAGADANALLEPDRSREAARQAGLKEMESRGMDVSTLLKTRKHQSVSVLDVAREGSRKVYAVLLERLGSEHVATDHYDATTAVLAGLKQAASEIAFSELSDEVSQRLNSKPRPWRRRGGVLQLTAKLKELAREGVVEDPDDELQWLESLQELVRDRGATLIYREIPEDARHEVKVLLAPTTDWAAIVRMCGTNGANYGLTTRDIVNRLAELRKKYPFEILGCGHDFAAVRFAPVTNYKPLDKELRAFCPDLSDDSPDDLEELKKFYSEDGRCFLWWD